MRIHKTHDIDYIETAKGNLKPRCQVHHWMTGDQCAKKESHVGKGDAIHSNGIFIWMDRNSLIQSTPEHAEEKLGHEPSSVPLDEENLMPLDPEQTLRQWWFERAADEIERTVPKAIEYGSDDLIEIGRQMAEAMDFAVMPSNAGLAELGVYFYMVGKMARWTSAIRRGDQVSDDTLFDIGVYVRMAQRIRHTGGWPGTEQK